MSKATKNVFTYKLTNIFTHIYGDTERYKFGDESKQIFP